MPTPFREPGRTERERNREKAFNLLELSVVLGVLVLLVCLTLPSLAASRSQTKQVQCAGNLRQLALAIHVYANDRNGILPTQGSGSWAWDMSGGVSSLLLGGGAKRQNFYCPANPEQNTDGLWNWALPQYRILGYVCAFRNTPSLAASNLNSTLTPQYTHVGPVTFPPQPAATRVLTADAIISQAGQNITSQKFTYTYTGIQGGWSKPHRTSHLDTVGRYPTGGNLGMIDGHVEWRPFQNVEARTTGNVPGFWW